MAERYDAEAPAVDRRLEWLEQCLTKLTATQRAYVQADLLLTCCCGCLEAARKLNTKKKDHRDDDPGALSGRLRRGGRNFGVR